MRFRRALIACFVLAGFAMQAHAQCAGFSDVTNIFNPFCTNVQWLKNRAITLGCTATTYCPNDPVNRLQMAAFMNRVGNVLTPRVLSVEGSGGALNLANPSFVCQTADLPDVGYNREVHADGSFSWNADASGVLQLSVFASFDSGATWQVAPESDVVVTVSMDGGGREQASLTLRREDLPGGGTGIRRLAIRVVRGTSLTTAMLTNWTCQFQVVVTTKAE